MVKVIAIKKKEIQGVSDLMLFVEKYKYGILKEICEYHDLDLDEQSRLLFPPNRLRDIRDSFRT